MRLSIIIPAHNEEKFIEQTIDKIFRLEIEKEVIIVNDGSTDNTQRILENLKNKYNFKLIKCEKNSGKGKAINNGLLEVTGDFLVIQDADLEYDPKDIPKLLEKIDENASAVYGNRGVKRWPKRGYYYVLGAKILSITINLLFGSKLKDVYTGYKLFNLKRVDLNMLKDLHSTGFEFEAEITCKILKSGGKILEIPITYIPRNKEEGKHIGLKDAFAGFFTIIKCRLGLDF